MGLFRVSFRDLCLTTAQLFLMGEDGGEVQTPVPFKFENMWLKEEGFKASLEDWWKGLNFRGSASFRAGNMS